MLNYIWLAFMLLAVIIGGATGHLEEVVKGAFDMAKSAVMDLALPLSAVITLWLGVMRLAEKSGLVFWLARVLRPILKFLFPEVPADHPAMGSIVMNVTANMLGLGNAATPMGLRAMTELQKLNPFPATATNAMCTFLTINTASIQLIPATAVAILAVNGAKNPTAIVGTAFLATLISQAVGLTAVKTLQNLPMFRAKPDSLSETTMSAAPEKPATTLPESPVQPAKITTGGTCLLVIFFAFFAWLFVVQAFPDLRPGYMPATTASGGIFISMVKAISLLAIPFFLSFFPLYAALRKIKVYEEFVEGAKEGFGVAIRIIPYLVTILVAIGMFRGAHGIEMMTNILRPVLSLIHFPPELVPLAFMRPLTGSGSIALVGDIVKTHGANNILSMMAATILGSTETTFYVLAVYFGSVGIKRTRHAIASGLLADIAGILASVYICQIVFG